MNNNRYIPNAYFNRPKTRLITPENPYCDTRSGFNLKRTKVDPRMVKGDRESLDNVWGYDAEGNIVNKDRVIDPHSSLAVQNDIISTGQMSTAVPLNYHNFDGGPQDSQYFKETIESTGGRCSNNYSSYFNQCNRILPENMQPVISESQRQNTSHMPRHTGQMAPIQNTTPLTRENLSRLDSTINQPCKQSQHVDRHLSYPVADWESYYPGANVRNDNPIVEHRNSQISQFRYGKY